MVKSILLAKDIGRFTKDISDRDKEAKKASPNLRNNLQKSVYTGLFLLEIPIFG